MGLFALGKFAAVAVAIAVAAKYTYTRAGAGLISDLSAYEVIYKSLISHPAERQSFTGTPNFYWNAKLLLEHQTFTGTPNFVCRFIRRFNKH